HLADVARRGRAAIASEDAGQVRALGRAADPRQDDRPRRPVSELSLLSRACVPRGTLKETTMRMLRLAAIAALSASMLTPASAQQSPNFAPPPLQRPTFSASTPPGGLTPGQLTTADVFCLNGSASKLIRVKRISISGTDTTAQTA